MYQQRDFTYKTARMIRNRYERGYVEDLHIDKMRRNGKLSNGIGDAGWGLLRGILTYMTERSLGVMALVDHRNMSQLCSRCRVIVPEPLSERTHRYPLCGLVLDRDVNAARNIFNRGIEIGLEQAEYTPEGEATTTQPSVV